MMQKKAMLVDGNSILNRAYYAFKNAAMLSTTEGIPTGAVFGFLNILNKYLKEESPQYLCVAFDLRAPTFRHQKYRAYKATRKGMPDELAAQLPIIKEVLAAMNVKIVEQEGYEADDIIGSISKFCEDRDIEVTILTGDKDALQLVSEKVAVIIVSTGGGKTKTVKYDTEEVYKKYGVSPRKLIDVKGLMGDVSDNIPGVPGVGEKTALKLIKLYGTIENTYENIEKISGKKLKENLINNKEKAFLSRELGTIFREIDCLSDVSEMKRVEFNKEALLEIFKRLEFKSLIKKYGLEDKETPELKKLGKINIIEQKEAAILLRESICEEKRFVFYHLIDRVDSWDLDLIAVAIAVKDQIVYIHFSKDFTAKDWVYDFKELLQDSKIKKIGHNVKEFITYLKKLNVYLKGLSFDTMIAEYIIDPSRDLYDISKISERYNSYAAVSKDELQGKGKNFKKFSELDSKGLSKVAGVYTAIVSDIWKKQISLLKETGQMELYEKIELPLIKVLAEMEYHGFRVDGDALHRYGTLLASKIKDLEEKIYLLSGQPFNINSPKQLGEILFNKLNLPVIKKTKTGYSTDIEVLESLYHRHAIIPLLIEYRQLVKLKNTYTDGLFKVINKETGKIHSSFNQTITVTGRISSTEPNLQNIPVRLEVGREIRKLFIPSSREFIFLDADYSQIELRVLAHITGDPALVNAFKNCEDIHTTTAAQIFGISPLEVTKDMRTKAKAVNFGIIYGISDFGLAKQLNISRDEAKSYIEGYLKKYPMVKKYMDNIIKEAEGKGYVTTLFGRRRYIPELKSKNFNIRSFGKRVALNTPIQGTAADIIKIAMVKVYSRLKEGSFKSRLILQVHDELLVETHESETGKVKAILKECMEQAAKLKVPLIAEIGQGKTWYAAKS